ncbi:hypothetical protein LINGRAHAP2_LOCUS28767 [Linum grandiflorum]
MSSTSKAWAVAASIGAVEALKDQLGFCRWNYVIRSAQQYARNNVRSMSQASSKLSSSSPVSAAMICDRLKEVEKSAAVVSSRLKEAQQSEESLRKVMYLSCWGPY